MKVALYLMNSKGLFTLQNFIKTFGSRAIEYVVAARDLKLENDAYHELKEVTNKHDVKFYDRTKFPIEVEQQFQGYKFSIGWRWLIQNEKNLIVFHDSLLPKYRGFAPLVNSLINKESLGGVTALMADVKYDCGDILAQKTIPFEYPLKIQEAIEKIEPLYFELISDIYQRLLNNEKLLTTKQKDNEATYSPWLDEEDYFIDWQWPAEKIERFVNAVGYPYSGAKARLNNEVITFYHVEAVEDLVVEHRERHIGKILLMDEGCPVVICKEGMLKFVDIRNSINKKIQINFRSRFK